MLPVLLRRAMRRVEASSSETCRETPPSAALPVAQPRWTTTAPASPAATACSSATSARSSTSDDCGACDVCLGELDLVDEPLVIAQKILSCVLRLEQRFGADYTSEVLAGSQRTADLASSATTA